MFDLVLELLLKPAIQLKSMDLILHIITRVGDPDPV